MLDQFSEANKLLESVQKGLSDYLETKRLAFARCGSRTNSQAPGRRSYTLRQPLGLGHSGNLKQKIASEQPGPRGRVGARGLEGASPLRIPILFFSPVPFLSMSLIVS